MGGGSVLVGCAESFNSNEFSHHHAEHDKSVAFAAFKNECCFCTHCAWFTCDLLKPEMSAGGGTTVGSPGLCTFTSMCLVLCRRDVGPHAHWTVKAGSEQEYRKAEL